MSRIVQEIIYYRTLEELRALFNRGSGNFHKIKLLLYVLTSLFFLFSMPKIYSMMFASFETQGMGNSSRLLGHLSAGLLIVNLLIFAITFFELLREIVYSKDQELLAVLPITAHQLLVYRMLFANLRAAPFCLGLALFPFCFIWFFLDHNANLVFLALLLIAHIIWVLLLALFSTCVILSVSNRWNISRHSLFFILYLSFIGFLTFGSVGLIGQGSWNDLVAHYRLHRTLLLFFPHHQLAQVISAYKDKDPTALIALSALFLSTSILSGAGIYFGTLRMWALASKPETAGKKAPRLSWIFGQRRTFATSRSWAIFQKDVKDLLRNPIHRYSLLSILALLLIGLWGQAMRLSQSASVVYSSPSKGTMMLSLSLLYLVPLVFSGRSVSLEFRMLDFYKLVLPRMGQLLDVKLRAQAIVNCLIAVIAAVPLFLFLKPGPRLLEVVFFLVSAFLLVPVLTMLAIALGTYFPKFSDLPEPLGIRLVGMVLYFAMTIPLYSLLLELYGCFLGQKANPTLGILTGAVALLVTLFALLLFARARKKISLLVSQYPAAGGRS